VLAAPGAAVTRRAGGGLHDDVRSGEAIGQSDGHRLRRERQAHSGQGAHSFVSRPLAIAKEAADDALEGITEVPREHGCEERAW